MRLYLRTMTQLIVLFIHAFRDPRMYVLVTFGLCILATGAVFFHFIEGWSWLDSLYFSTVTLATVGFGDLHPVTPLGKLFTIAYILLGVGIFVAIFAFMSRFGLEEMNSPPKSPTGEDKDLTSRQP